MTRTEQERVVMQYLNGDLSPEAEQEFFIQVATDDDLRQTLNAFRVVETALRKHRDAAATQHSTTRTHVLGALGMMPTNSVVETTSTSRWLIVGASLCSIILGTFVLAPLLGTSNSASNTVKQEPAAIQTRALPTTQPNETVINRTGESAVQAVSHSTTNRDLSRTTQTSGSQRTKPASIGAPSRTINPSAISTDAANINAVSTTLPKSDVTPTLHMTSAPDLTPASTNVTPASSNVSPASMHTDRSTVDTVLIRVKMDANPD